VNDECFVLVPDGDGGWATACFVEADGVPDRHYRDGRRTHQLTKDRILPGCAGGTYDRANVHPAHLHCQKTQGAYLTVELHVGAHAMAHEAKVALGRRLNDWRKDHPDQVRANALNGNAGRLRWVAEHQEEAKATGRKVAHITNHINRGITKPGCEHCDALEA
jgi:hypothetical protein